MWNLEIMGIDLYHIIAWFYVYSVLGWIWESSYVSIKSKKLVNRGFVTGPVCTIYGVGAVTVYVTLHNFDRQWVLLFLLGSLLATILEYVTAVVMEQIFHTRWWDYTNKKFNFQGRICLGSSVGWGFFTLIMFVVLQPAVEWIVNLVTQQMGQILIIAATMIYAVDFTFAAISAGQLGRKLEQLEKAAVEMYSELHKSKFYITAEEFMERLESYRTNFSKISVKDRMEELRAQMEARLEEAGITVQTEQIMDKLKNVMEKSSTVFSRNNFNTRRFLRSYPNLKATSGIEKRIKMLKDHLEGKE